MMMTSILSESTKNAAYLLWEATGYKNALDLWYCAEDIAFYFEENDIISMAALEQVLLKGSKDKEYISFIKQISYRIYESTKNNDHILNWFLVEGLLSNYEWCSSIVNMAYIFRSLRESKKKSSIRTEWIKRELEK